MTRVEELRIAFLTHGSIRVGPYDFALVLELPEGEPADGAFYGRFSSTHMAIEVTAESKTPIVLADTVIHELSHAIFWTYHVRARDSEERIVSTTASGWAQVYRDNPWLLEWLSEATR